MLNYLLPLYSVLGGGLSFSSLPKLLSSYVYSSGRCSRRFRCAAGFEEDAKERSSMISFLEYRALESTKLILFLTCSCTLVILKSDTQQDPLVF